MFRSNRKAPQLAPRTAGHPTSRPAAGRPTIEPLDRRLLLAVTHTITAELADQGVTSVGTFPYVGQSSIRVGDNGNNTSEQSAVFPFKLPALPAGATITSATASFNLESIGNAASVSGNADVYALGHRSASTVLAGDFFRGAYGTDSTDATAIQATLATKTTAPGVLTLGSTGGGNLATYLQSEYAAGATANEFVFLRISAQVDQLTSRYWVFSTANHATAGLRPTLTFTYETATAPAAPSNPASVTTSSSSIQLNWQDNSGNETGFAIERSTDGISFTSAGTVGANVTTFTDTGRAADTKYFYRVRATSGGGDSAHTAVISNRTIPSFVHTYWVDKSFTGTSTGSFAAPFKTIQSTINLAVAGDGVVIRGGTYFEQLTMKGGTAGLPVTLMSQPNERAVISGHGTISGWTLLGGNTYSTVINWKPTAFYVNNTQQELSRSPNEGWWTAPTVTQSGGITTITDPTHLAGIPSLVGGYVQAHTVAGNNYGGAEIATHDTVNGIVTLVGTKLGAMASNDYYLIKNTINLIDRPGEWAAANNGDGTYTVFFNPVNASDLNATQARKTASRQILVPNAVDYVTIRGLEVTGNAAMGIEVAGKSTSTVTGVTVRDSIVHNNGGTGISFRYTADSVAQRNMSLNNGNGISMSSTVGGLIDQNEVAYSSIDGIIVSGDVSGTQPGGTNFSPSSDIVVSNNYIHDHIAVGHPDGIQMYRWVSDVHVINNFVQNSGQGLMTEQVDGGEVAGNIFWNAGAFMVRFDHSNSMNWDVHNNTIGGSGYGPYTMTATGYNMTENITIGRVGVPSVTGSQYTGDRNLYHNPINANFLRTSTPSKNYSSVATFFADTGQDQHSASGNPLFANAPLIATVADNILLSTTTALKVRDVTGFVVGDHIQIGGDGVVRTVTAIDTVNKILTFDVALPTKPMWPTTVVENWKMGTNFNLDFTLTAGSPGLTLSSTGGRVGSLISASAYIAGDYNNDGARDIPALAPDIALGLPKPNLIPPPSF